MNPTPSTPSSNETISGVLSEGEQLFLRQIRELLDATISGRFPFFAAMENLLLDLREIRKHGFDVDATLGSEFQFVSGRAASASVRARLLDSEKAFLRDMDSLVDYAVRNGITFLTLIRPMLHDVSELKGYDWSLEKAAADSFLPAVTGWAERNLQPAGQSEELE